MSEVVAFQPSAPSLRRSIERSATGRIESDAAAIGGDLGGLAERLADRLKGEVRFDAGSRALYATDASNYRQVPIGVVVPRNVEDVIETIAVCRHYGVPLVLRGGGTSLAGQTCNVAVLIDCSKYLHRVLSLDAKAKRAEVEPGCILDHLRDAAEQYHLTFGPDPATHDHNTLGGMLGNNSCGVHSIMSGRTSDNVESLDIVTYRGLRMTVGPTGEDELQSIAAGDGARAEIYRKLDAFRKRYGPLIREKYPDIPRRVSGYENLDQLLPENGGNVARALVGTEGTCVTILKARLQLMPSPPERVLAIIGFDDVFAAADAVPDVLSFGPIGLEGMDGMLIDFMRRKQLDADDLKLLPEGDGRLLAEFGAENQKQARQKASKLIDAYKAKGHDAKLLIAATEQGRIWEVREAALAATAHVPDYPETFPGWEDSAVPREKLGDYLRDLKRLFHRHGYDASVYGHFGDGLVHCRIDFDLRSEHGLNNWQHFLEEAADLVTGYGGSLSGEHGDGQARAALLTRMYGPELVRAFGEFKAIWDPDGKMNPGKVIDPFPITSNLRIGPEYRPPEVSSHFAYLDDAGSFTKATRRCVGVGACRRRDSEKGVMCPSYMATGEEKNSTRGRARLLFEMLHGGPLDQGWRSEAVEDALSLCLACKGCKHDCPVQVDMATYKAEFRSHYYDGRLRPRAAYSMGQIHRWARLASHAPRLANLFTRTPGLSRLSKWVGGIAQARSMPAFARRDLRKRLARHLGKGSSVGAKGDLRVMLWPDTFNTYFRPETGMAAVKVLEGLGASVTIPKRALCCGRPLYDWGYLDQAKRLWRETLDALAEEINSGTLLVGLEPACVSAFRDELPGLFPFDERAKALAKQTLFLTEFIDQYVEASALPRIDAKALVQIHCHQHAVLDAKAEARVLERMGVDFEVMKSGCCGMAGSFGFEADKYDVSLKAAERVLLPKICEAKPETLILANGFSCREQIEQETGRKTQHIAELIASAL
jgi:FAD/FMN-containing dehydrogenase/Fe-S oxidoreductase